MVKSVFGPSEMMLWVKKANELPTTPIRDTVRLRRWSLKARFAYFAIAPTRRAESGRRRPPWGWRWQRGSSDMRD